MENTSVNKENTTRVIIGNWIHGKTNARYRRGRNINPTTSAIGNLIFLPTRKLNTAGSLLSYNQAVSSGVDGRDGGGVRIGVTRWVVVKKRAKWNLSA